LSSSEKIGIVILAAGASTRLGEPKQLLEYDRKNLLQRTIDAAVNSNADTVIVVLGANAEQVSKEIDRSKINVVINTEWEEGMASSVRNGLNEVLFISPSIDAVILMVCDQPYISSELINDIIDKQKETGKTIVTCNYGKTFGPPALFDKSLFHELMQLKGDVGARNIIHQHSDEVVTVLFAKGNIDIDTKEDYDGLNNS
jgi:molybdenum cofactor cytidylyltransferase